MQRKDSIQQLMAFDESSQILNVIVETPRDHRNKYTYNPDLNLFELGGLLPAGAVFPYDFGFVPQTIGEDGDPLDVLVLMDEAAFVGCLVRTRLIGVIKAVQTERSGKKVRNDRLIAVSEQSETFTEIDSLSDLPKSLIEQVEHFFVSYNVQKGKAFEPKGRHGPRKAEALVKDGIKRFKSKR